MHLLFDTATAWLETSLRESSDSLLCHRLVHSDSLINKQISYAHSMRTQSLKTEGPFPESGPMAAMVDDTYLLQETNIPCYLGQHFFLQK